MAKNTATIIGLTGNICSGKSGVLKMFQKYGCEIISSDKLAHHLLSENEEVKRKVVKYFGTTERPKLAEIVFINAKKRVLLETILHPQINRIIDERINKISPGSIVVIEIPLLFETGWDKKVDYVVFVSCPIEIRKKRYYKGKNVSAGEFECRDTAQMSEANKAKRSHFVIDNSKDLNFTEDQVKNVIENIKKRDLYPN